MQRFHISLLLFQCWSSTQSRGFMCSKRFKVNGWLLKLCWTLISVLKLVPSIIGQGESYVELRYQSWSSCYRLSDRVTGFRTLNTLTGLKHCTALDDVEMKILKLPVSVARSLNFPPRSVDVSIKKKEEKVRKNNHRAPVALGPLARNAFFLAALSPREFRRASEAGSF